VSLDSLEGTIYDVSGSPVADIRFDSYRGGDIERYVWDGRDGNGNVVRAGIYIYEIQGGGKSVTGTVVVAK
jgi:flagellar hook assembly protein FlgD